VVERVRPVTLAGEQVLPVVAALEPLVPSGVQRGSVVAVTGGGAAGATSLALALAAGPSAAGSWTAAIGFPSLGLLAAAELGVSLERLALVAAPEPGTWGTVAATLVDAFDVVLVGGSSRRRTGDVRRLVARARERGAVVVPVGGAAAGFEPDVRLMVVESVWEGLGRGHGHLAARRVVVEATGRRGSARPRRAELWLPDREGAIRVAQVMPAADRADRPGLREVG
jgi:hypothetical protein